LHYFIARKGKSGTVLSVKRKRGREREMKGTDEENGIE
jgi:hypothetical protein